MIFINLVTLLGGHTVGHVHVENSGYGIPQNLFPVSNLLNAWDPTPNVFDNEYYKDIANLIWGSLPQNKLNDQAKLQSGDPRKVIWLTGTPSIKLNPDMALVFNISLAYDGLTIPSSDVNVLGQICGPVNETALRTGIPNTVPGSNGNLNVGPFEANNSTHGLRACSSTGDFNSTQIMTLIGFEATTNPLVKKYATDNHFFLQAFQKAFDKMVTVGYEDNSKLGGQLKLITDQL